MAATTKTAKPAIAFFTDEYEATHGKKPSGHGVYAFSVEAYVGDHHGDLFTEAEPLFVPASGYPEARRLAISASIARAIELGVEVTEINITALT
jgi:hypothetical protein